MKKEDYEYIENTIRDLSYFVRKCRLEDEREEFKKKFRLIKNDNPPLPSQENVVSKFNIVKEEKGVSNINYKGEIEMLIKIPGVSINKKPRKDGRFQGYIVTNKGKIYVYGKTYKEVISKINEIYKNGPPKQRAKSLPTYKGIPATFNAFAMYYFKNFSEKKVAPATLKSDLIRYNKYLAPALEEKLLKNILPLDCQKIIESLTLSGKGKTADEVHCLLSLIFKMAIKHGIITRNPIDVIYHQKHERKHGSALSKNEELLLKEKLSKDFPFIMVALYTGLRPNEYATACIKENFIIAENSKRKHKRKEYKKIPIIKALKPYLKNGIPAVPNLEKLRKEFKIIFPERRIYDLRTTFYTRCKEFGVAEPALNHCVGHSSGVLANTYTTLSDAYLLKEGKKLDVWK